MANCTDVKVCLAEGGSTQCIMLSGNSNDCPPCLYAITGGGFSCYSRQKKKCPFAPVFAVCEQSDSTPSPSGSSNRTGSTSKPVTKASAVDSSETSTSPKTTDSNKDTSTPGAPASAHTTGSNATQSSELPLSSSSTSNGTVLSNTTAASSSSNTVASLALVGGAAVLLVIVIIFVACRMAKKKKKEQVKKLDCTVSTRESDETLSSGASSANLYSTCGYKIEGGSVNGISMLTDSQANSTYGPDYADQTIQSGPSSRPMADFSSYSEPQFSNNSRFSGMGLNGQQHYANNDMPTPLTQAGSHFMNVTPSLKSNRSTGLDMSRSGEHPLTVSQLMPTVTTAAAGRYDKGAYKTQQKAGSLVYGHVPPRAFDSAISQSNRQFGVSTASSMRSDYDIVDPVTMREAEVRDSEMLAEANCYPKFSFESEADIYDGESSEEESNDDEPLRHGVEHTI